MRLLELTRSYYPSVGGMEKYVLERTKIYEQLGVEYSILATSYTTEKKDDTIPVKNVKYLRQCTPYNITPTLPFYLKNEYDIISVNMLGRFYSDYAIYHYRKRNRKIILTPYFAYHSDRLEHIKKRMETYFFPKLLDKIDALIVFTEYEKYFWCQKYGVDERRVYVIPPYITMDADDQFSSTHASQERYLLYVGRSESNKKTNLLIEAFLRLGKKNISLFLTLRPEDVAKELRALVLSNKRIRLLGFIHEGEKERLMAGAEALIFPTSWESFGYVAFEASKLKKPLVCSDIPVLRESLDPNGVLYFRNETQHLVEILEEFLSYSSEKKMHMGQTNYLHLQKFSFETACVQYKKLFTSFMNT